MLILYKLLAALCRAQLKLLDALIWCCEGVVNIREKELEALRDDSV